MDSTPDKIYDAARFERDKERIDDAVEHIGRTLLILLLLAVGPALVIVAAWVLIWIYVRWANTHYDAAIDALAHTEFCKPG